MYTAFMFFQLVAAVGLYKSFGSETKKMEGKGYHSDLTLATQLLFAVSYDKLFTVRYGKGLPYLKNLK